MEADGDNQVIGVVPDGVRLVKVKSRDGSETPAVVHNNVYGASVHAAASLSYEERDGTIETVDLGLPTQTPQEIVKQVLADR